MQRTIAVLPKNTGEELKIEIQEYNGFDLLALRVFIKDPLGQEPRPSRKGLTIRTRMIPSSITINYIN